MGVCAGAPGLLLPASLCLGAPVLKKREAVANTVCEGKALQHMQASVRVGMRAEPAPCLLLPASLCWEAPVLKVLKVLKQEAVKG